MVFGCPWLSPKSSGGGQRCTRLFVLGEWPSGAYKKLILISFVCWFLDQFPDMVTYALDGYQKMMNWKHYAFFEICFTVLTISIFNFRDQHTKNWCFRNLLHPVELGMSINPIRTGGEFPEASLSTPWKNDIASMGRIVYFLTLHPTKKFV